MAFTFEDLFEETLILFPFLQARYQDSWLCSMPNRNKSNTGNNRDSNKNSFSYHYLLIYLINILSGNKVYFIIIPNHLTF